MYSVVVAETLKRGGKIRRYAPGHEERDSTMRRNQTLRILLPFLLVCAVATATASQLTGVSVSSQGSLTTVTIRVSGTFTHTEYRPAENMLMVDLAGVSATKLDGKMEAVSSNGVQAY